ELQLQEPGDEQFGHLHARGQVLEGPDDALQISSWQPLCSEKELAALRTNPGIIEIDREVRSVCVERSALQSERTVELAFCPLLEKKILAFVKTQHCSAVELARLRVFREEDRVVD